MAQVALLPTLLVTALVAVPFSGAGTIRSSSAVSATFTWHVSLAPTQSLTRLAGGSIAVVAPWPPDVLGAGDGTEYPPEQSDHAPPPLPDPDPYEFSADPDGSMAADEAMHDVGPFDPAYADEYKPDYGVDDPDDPDSPENANSGPPPGPDTSDPSDPSDDEVVGESDPSDAIYDIEASRSDQVIALIGAPRAVDSLGQTIPSWLRITGRNTLELMLGPSLIGPAYPLAATSDVIFNPDADPSSVVVTP